MWIIGSIYPALIGENPAKHAAAVAQSRSFSYNGGRHWVVPSNTDTHDKTHSKEIPELIPSRTFEMVWQADDENHTNDHDDHLLSVDKSSAEGITQETERELSNNVTDICCRVYCASKEEWIGRVLLSLQTSPISVGGSSQCKASKREGDSSRGVRDHRKHLKLRGEVKPVKGDGKDILICPDWGHQIDDEKVVGVKEEANTMHSQSDT